MTPRPFQLLTRLPRADLGIALFYLVFGAIVQLAGINILSSFPLHLGLGPALWPVALLLGCAGVTLRSTRPKLMITLCAIAAALALLSDAGIICLLLVFEIIFSGVLYGSERLSRASQLVAVLLSVLSVLWAVAATANLQAILAFALQAVIVFLTPMWWAGNVRTHRQIAQAEQQRADQAAQLVAQERRLAALDTQLAIATERSRMARDLHDVIAGRLSAIALQSEAALRSTDPELQSEVLQTARRSSVQALTDMRQMIDMLHGGGPDPDSRQSAGAADLAAELRALAKNSSSLDAEIELDFSAVPEISAGSANTLYRICQEALVNAAKHAPGQRILIDLHAAGEDVVLRVYNRLPKELPAPQGTGRGLQNMAFRAQQLGGTFAASAIAEQWQLETRIPR
ncbi:sensor histidine kinase [Psychromicrobium lacuslunae]|uniref:histidine kinase n=1 Tax=Psychromicrobium lacuslunae TaxID=1618207 RepID=A0A0D4BVM3_9MICC|nr:histidine kinase [Psychromicrobium lacuslunae]AJT40369.1 hypothetical protein UM93_00210 [Psychromicrobium lacuslunae]